MEMPPENIIDVAELMRRRNLKPTQEPAFLTLTFQQLMDKQFTENWIIQDVVEAGDLGLIFGAPASGKSFLVQDMCYCVAANIGKFHGKNTVSGNVLYICGEGYSGLQKRFRALREKYGVDAERLHISMQSADLMSEQSAILVKKKMDEIGDVRLVVIDTLHRNMGAGDENSSKDFSVFLSNLDCYIKTEHCAVLIVHHSGHGANDRARGTSAIRGAMEAEFGVTKDENTQVITFKCHKMKNHQEPVPMCFEMNTVGDSVVLTRKAYDSDKKQKLSERATLAFDALIDIEDEKGIAPPYEVQALFHVDPKKHQNVSSVLRIGDR
jgi:hypothetical protein